jgi:hypothetical protein
MEKLIEGFAAKIAHKLMVEGRDLDDLVLVQLI